ncbi:arsenite methyltransferase protein [Rutstroemia sp. NJR-2017a WRK4]|nr:SAM-dependent methyltransferase COQ5 family protein [Rutstroemia sp. NJR-2017a BBW]PQE10311.1 arsenite methyltransferase protein [Rutstroemia sp. NJR-2017a WRK4]
MAAVNEKNDSMYSLINNHYSGLARTTPHDSEISQKIAKAFAYDDEDLGAIPAGANLGVSCGNPVVLGKLRQSTMEVSRNEPDVPMPANESESSLEPWNKGRLRFATQR